MARAAKRLSARAVQTVTGPALHADGDRISLFVYQSGAKRWRVVFQWHGRRQKMGWGSSRPLSCRCREAAYRARGLAAKGKNPIALREAERAKNSNQTLRIFADRRDAGNASGSRAHRRLAAYGRQYDSSRPQSDSRRKRGTHRLDFGRSRGAFTTKTTLERTIKDALSGSSRQAARSRTTVPFPPFWRRLAAFLNLAAARIWLRDFFHRA